MPFIMIIVLLLMVITGLLVYFFMFYKPSQDLCSNLYASNICTDEMCTTLEVCPAIPEVEWKPEVKADTGKFLGYGVEESLDGTFGTAYTTGLTSLESEFGSNVCDTLTTMDLAAYHPAAPTAGDANETDKAAREGKINCIKMINKIDAELGKTDLTWLEKSKLLEARRAMINACSPLDDGQTERTVFDIDADATFPTAAITGKKDGAISKLFCT
jgi:hypothetical protein